MNVPWRIQSWTNNIENMVGRSGAPQSYKNWCIIICHMWIFKTPHLQGSCRKPINVHKARCRYILCEYDMNLIWIWSDGWFMESQSKWTHLPFLCQLSAACNIGNHPRRSYPSPAPRSQKSTCWKSFAGDRLTYRRTIWFRVGWPWRYPQPERKDMELMELQLLWRAIRQLFHGGFGSPSSAVAIICTNGPERQGAKSCWIIVLIPRKLKLW